jgi:hypothetical protein
VEVSAIKPKSRACTLGFEEAYRIEHNIYTQQHTESRITLDLVPHSTAQPLHHEIPGPPCYNLCHPKSTFFAMMRNSKEALIKTLPTTHSQRRTSFRLFVHKPKVSVYSRREILGRLLHTTATNLSFSPPESGAIDSCQKSK